MSTKRGQAEISIGVIFELIHDVIIGSMWVLSLVQPKAAGTPHWPLSKSVITTNG
jgi:hypothetical protein